MKTKWNWFLILAILFGLVFTVPPQPVLADASATANFTFASSPNPSNSGQPVTFTLSATGSDPTYPPFGYVNFFDNGVLIAGCSSVELNFPNTQPSPGVPANCTTTSLAAGAHTITAQFTSIISSVYADETVTLAGGQTVNAPIALTITPSTLPDAMITMIYATTFIATYPDGTVCRDCTWYSNQGELPAGTALGAVTGVLQGKPEAVGAYSFTINAMDANGARGSRNYTWNVTRVIPVITVTPATTYIDTTTSVTLSATVQRPDVFTQPQLSGKVSFSVNGVAVPGCSGEFALAINAYGKVDCSGYLPIGLSAGIYPIQADFTPDSASSQVYQNASGTGSLQVLSEAPAQVTGLVFMDDDQDGVKDENEMAQGNWNIFLNQDCDSFMDWNTVTEPYTGSFSFADVPTDHTYCLFVSLNSPYIQTTQWNNLTLEGSEYFEIGVYYPHITILPTSEQLPFGGEGTYYEQTISVIGGTPPYTIAASYEELYPLPQGLAFDVDTLTLSGTPTTGGLGQFGITVDDSAGLHAAMTYWLAVLAQGEFSLTSSANPSAPGQPVTFSLSGAGDVIYPDSGPLPPYGLVAFTDNDLPIPGCEETMLNYNIDTGEIGDFPASCTTSALSEGQHIIKAFYANPDVLYLPATLSLTQVVAAVPSLAIVQETLPAAAYQTPYSQQLSASGGTGPYTFSLASGALPTGITLSGAGLLSGFADSPAAPGTYPITIQVVDASGTSASRDYNFMLGKGVPTIEARASTQIFWKSPFSISAVVTMPISDTQSNLLGGTVAFSIDETPVPGCDAVTDVNGYYSCSAVSMDLAVGKHIVKADYTPTGWYSAYYETGSGSTEITVQPYSLPIVVDLFFDTNKDGQWGESESAIHKSGWTVNLDQGCDGTVDYTGLTSWGAFQFNNIPVSGQCHRITITPEPGYQQTTQLADFVPVPGSNNLQEIGFFYPTIILSPGGSSGPGSYELSSGTINEAYTQAFSASGGTAPYEYTIVNSTLPNGLNLSSDGILSGTPISTGGYYFTVQAKDATEATGQKQYHLSIERVKVDGAFTFTSSANPSVVGDAVTFTLSATGDAVIPDYGPIPPVGVVSFFDDETPIAGCANLYLNLATDENGEPTFADYPATCSTAALTVGSHAITAAFTDLMGYYNNATLSLQQVINAVTPPAISQETLPNAEYLAPYSLQLAASGGKAPYTFSLVSGALPSGMTLDSTGLLSGTPNWPDEPGNYNVTIQVKDANNLTASRAYTLVEDKTTPVVEVGSSLNIYYNSPFTIWANVKKDAGDGSYYNLPGTVSFSIDGQPVPVCGAVAAESGYAQCTGVSMDLVVGKHTLSAAYTPYYENWYKSGTGSSEFSVQPSYYMIYGALFNDLNQNGMWDANEYSLNAAGITANLDQACDGTVNGSFPVTSGAFAFYSQLGGECYRIALSGITGYQQTTSLNDFVLKNNKTDITIGLYYPTITLTPSELPGGKVGLAYNQTLSASGGSGPYTYSVSEGSLPAGLSLSEAGILSGTPTTAGIYQFRLAAKDANQAVGQRYYSVNIKMDGAFTFTASPNPSDVGASVTFTLSATGSAVHPNYGAIPPVGGVTFFADGTPIAGCSDLYLNLSPDWVISAIPVTCTTAGLSVGTHAITATFTDWYGLYNDATLSLTQVVKAIISADLSITKVDKLDPVKPGARLVYTLTVSNQGPNKAESITLVDRLDINTTFVSITAPKGWTCKNAKGTVTCTKSSMASGETAVFTLTVTVSKTAKVGKELVNNAGVSSLTSDPNLSNNTVVEKTMVVK